MKLLDAFSIIRNGISIKQYDNASGLPITRIETISNRVIDRSKCGYADIFDIKKYRDYVMQDGDILMSHINSVQHLGKTALYRKSNDEVIIHGMNLLMLRPKQEVIEPQYAYIALNSPKFLHQLPRITKKSVNQASFSVSDLKELDIDVPSISKQQKIARNIDTIENLISNRQKALSVLDELVKSRFIELFGDLRINPCGWEIHSFTDLTDLITDGEHATPRRVPQGIYLLSARNVLNHSIQLEAGDYIDEEEYNRIAKRLVPQEGDVLISCSGSVGRCCSVPAGLKFQMVRSAALLRFKSFINPVFAEYMITSDYLQEQINSAKTASSQANLFQGKIAKLKGVAPPIDLQNQFADFVQLTDKSKFAIQQSIDTLQTLKAKLMQDYFG